MKALVICEYKIIAHSNSFLNYASKTASIAMIKKHFNIIKFKF